MRYGIAGWSHGSSGPRSVWQGCHDDEMTFLASAISYRPSVLVLLCIKPMNIS
jgi:hypothetical protein